MRAKEEARAMVARVEVQARHLLLGMSVILDCVRKVFVGGRTDLW